MLVPNPDKREHNISTEPHWSDSDGIIRPYNSETKRVQIDKNHQGKW